MEIGEEEEKRRRGRPKKTAKGETKEANGMKNFLETEKIASESKGIDKGKKLSRTPVKKSQTAVNTEENNVTIRGGEGSGGEADEADETAEAGEGEDKEGEMTIQKDRTGVSDSTREWVRRMNEIMNELEIRLMKAEERSAEEEKELIFLRDKSRQNEIVINRLGATIIEQRERVDKDEDRTGKLEVRISATEEIVECERNARLAGDDFVKSDNGTGDDKSANCSGNSSDQESESVVRRDRGAGEWVGRGKASAADELEGGGSEESVSSRVVRVEREVRQNRTDVFGKGERRE